MALGQVCVCGVHRVLETCQESTSNCDEKDQPCFSLDVPPPVYKTHWILGLLLGQKEDLTGSTEGRVALHLDIKDTTTGISPPHSQSTITTCGSRIKLFHRRYSVIEIERQGS